MIYRFMWWIDWFPGVTDIAVLVLFLEQLMLLQDHLFNLWNTVQSHTWWVRVWRHKCGEKGQKSCFHEEWQRKFDRIRYLRATNSMNCKFCSRYPQHMGNTKFEGNAGTAQLKHNTLVKHSASLWRNICCDLYSNENATPLSMHL